jgi:hypothetical protein
MTKQEFIENNRLIAEFMEWEIDPKFFFWHTKTIEKKYILPYLKNGYLFDLFFHEDLNWLMSVIREIGEKTGNGLVISSSYCYWNQFGEDPFNGEEFAGYESPIEDGLFLAVVKFIKWFKTQEE